MTNKQHLQALLDRVTDGTICDRSVDPADDCALIYTCFPDDVDGYGMFETASVTEVFGLIMDGSLDAAVEFVQAALPGWAWRIGECSVSSDAWVFPDFNSPIHGKILSFEFPQLINGMEFSEFTDIEMRPAGNPARALLMSALMALIAVAK